jgi:hypothetical protein
VEKDGGGEGWRKTEEEKEMMWWRKLEEEDGSVMRDYAIMMEVGKKLMFLKFPGSTRSSL